MLVTFLMRDRAHSPTPFRFFYNRRGGCNWSICCKMHDSQHEHNGSTPAEPSTSLVLWDT